MKCHLCVPTVCILVNLFCLVGSTSANPEGESVAAGGASFDRSMTGRLTIHQKTDKAIINWRDFSIGAGELTKFIQPSASAAALNRVMSGNPSQIYGTLEANGRIYLINPSGILVGPGGVVNTMGFIASTLDVSDAGFLAGSDLVFSGNSIAGIKNEGKIEALGGSVILTARTVENAGTIRAPNGTVGLAAGSEVLLTQAGDRISVLAGNGSAPQADKGVNNVGTVEAARAELEAAGGNVYALAINNGGVVRATSVSRENGKIVLKASGGNIENSGQLAAQNQDGSGGAIVVDAGHNRSTAATLINSGRVEARGETAGTQGGDVRLLGDNVALVGKAVVDVSGDAGGGRALIGGGLRGNNAAVANADKVFVGSEATIKADALTAGDGGRAIIWSDALTRFYGSVSARGGAQSGDGGFVEISSGVSMQAGGDINLSAPHGNTGTLLYDPLNILIQGGSGDGDDDPNTSATGLRNVTGSDTLGSILFADEGAGSPDPFVIRESEIEGTDANIILEARNSIKVSGTFDNQVSAEGPNVVLIQSGRSLTMRTRNNAGEGIEGIDLTAGGTLNDLEFRTRDGGSITLQTGTGGSEVGSAPITVGKLTTAGHTTDTTATPDTDTGGSITIEAEGTLTVNGALSTDNIAGANDHSVTTGSIMLTSKDANVVINTAIKTGNATVNDADDDHDGISGNITITAGTSVTVNSPGALTTGNASSTGASSGNDTTTSGKIDVTAGANGSISVGGNFATGDATVVDGQGSGGDIDAARSGSITLLAGTAVSGAGRLITGNGSVTGANNNGSDSATSGSVSVTAGSGMASGGIGLAGITIGTAQRAGGGAVDAATSGNITLNSFDEINNGMASQPLSVLIGAASGSGNNNQGRVAATTTGAGGNILLTSGSGLEVGVLRTVGASAQIVNVALTGPASSILQVNDATETLSGDTVSLNAGVGTLVMDDSDFNVGTGTLTLTGDEIDFTGGDDSIRGMNGHLVIQPATPTVGIELAGSGSATTLDIGAGGLDALMNGFETITIGRLADGSGTLTIAGAANFSDKVTLVGGSIASNAKLTSTEDVTLIARTGGITDGNGSSVNVDAPTLSARAETGINLDTTITTLALAEANGVGNIDIRDTDDIILKTVNASGDTATIDAEGSIFDDLDDTTRLTARTAVLIADDAIGAAGNEIDTSVDTLTANASAGGVFIREQDSVRLQSVSASGGANAVDIRNAAGNMTVVSVTAPGSITLVSQGSVLNDNDSATRIRSGGAVNTTIRAGLNIGTTANPLDVDGVSGGTVDLDARFGAVHVNTVTDGQVAFTASSAAVPGQITTSFTRGGGLVYNATYANGAAGDFTLTAHGDIRQGTLVGPVLVPTALLTLNSVMPGADIGTADIPLLVQARDLSLNTVGDMAANGNASVQGEAINFTASSVEGTLRATATVGNITDNAAVRVTGNAEFTTTASGGDIVLDSGLNVSGTIGLHTADALGDATIINLSDIDFAASTVGGILSARASGSIAQSGDITAAELRATATGGAVTLDGNNDVNRLAGSASGNGNGFSFTDVDDVTIETVDGVSGIATANGAISLTANSMEVAQTVNSGTARTILQPRTGGQDIDLGSETVGKLSLTDAELDFVDAGVLQIGNNSAGSIDISAAIAPANSSTLSLINDDSVGGIGSISVASLRINAGGPVTLTGDNDVTTLAAGVSSAGSAFSFRDRDGLNVGTVDTVAGISTDNGAVTLTADSLGIGASVNSGIARTTLEPGTSGREIDLGSETGGKLSLTDTELDSVSAGVLQIGNNSAGSIDVSADLTQTAKPTLTLVSGGSVSGPGSIEASALRIRSVGSVTLDNDNDVSTLAATVLGVGNRFSFSDLGSVNVGSVDGDAGITTLGGSVDLTTDTLGIQSSINSGNGGVTLTADSIAVGEAVNSGTARTILQPRANGRNIDLGSETAGKFSLTDAELDNVTASILQVGNNRSGSIDLSAAVSPAGASTLSLINNSSVSGGGNVRVTDLHVRAAGQVNLQGNVTTLAGFASGGNRFAFRDNNNVTIGTVDGRAGIQTQGGDIAVTADTLDIANRVQSGGGSVTLTANRLDIRQEVNAGQAGLVTIQPQSAGKSITLGLESGSALSLSGDELSRVTADTIRVGNPTAGSININESLTLDNRILTLQSGDSITETGAGALTVDELCIGTSRSSAVVSLAGQNDVNVLAAEGAPVTFHDIDDLDRLTAVDLCAPGVPVGSDLLLFGGNVTVRVLSEQLASIAFVDIPTPRAANRTLFAETAIDSSLVAALVGPDSIWTSSLHVPFPGEQPLRYRIEEESKWLGGHLAISGTTTGPQTPR